MPATPEVRARASDTARGLAFAAPALAFTLLFFLVPFSIMAAWSLFSGSGASLDTTLSLTNYARLFGEPALRVTLWNSLVVGGLVTVVSLALGYPSPTPSPSTCRSVGSGSCSS